MPASAQEYQKLLAREKARYKGDRDRAVRSANVAAGYGSSTAERKAPAGGAKAKPAGGAKRQAAGGGAKRKQSRSPYKLTRSPTSEPSVARGPTTVPSEPQPTMSMTSVPGMEARGPTTQPGFLADTAFQMPPNPTMAQGSILQTVPPELRAPMPGPGQPGPDIGLGMQPQQMPVGPGQPSAALGLAMQPQRQQLAQQLAQPRPPVSGLFGNQPLIDRGGYGLPKLW